MYSKHLCCKNLAYCLFFWTVQTEDIMLSYFLTFAKCTDSPLSKVIWISCFLHLLLFIWQNIKHSTITIGAPMYSKLLCCKNLAYLFILEFYISIITILKLATMLNDTASRLIICKPPWVRVLKRANSMADNSLQVELLIISCCSKGLWHICSLLKFKYALQAEALASE